MKYTFSSVYHLYKVYFKCAEFLQGGLLANEKEEKFASNNNKHYCILLGRGVGRNHTGTCGVTCQA